MWRTFVAVLILITYHPSMSISEEQRAIVHVYGSSRIKVKLECTSKFMNVNLFLNGTAPFFDWIVVGKTNRPECRQQGNGDLQYLIEIPLMNDPCGTRIIDASSTFENVISIKRMPLLILEGDETISVQCVYGPPEIGTQIIPTLPPSQNVQQSFLTTPPKKEQQPLDDSPPESSIESTKNAGILPAHIYLIVFMVLFLTLLCLCCGCMYFFFKRRKLRVERRKKLLLAVPPNSEMSKLGLRHLWWSGKHSSGVSHGHGAGPGAGGGASTVGDGTVVSSNEGLLSHDYMISTNSTARGHLSVSTDYPGSTPPSSGGSSQGTAAGLIINRGDPSGAAIGSHDHDGDAHSPDASSAGSENHHRQTLYVHDDRRMLAAPSNSRSHLDNHPMAGVSRSVPGVNLLVNSLRCIPEERYDAASSSGGANGSLRSQQQQQQQKSQSQHQLIARRPLYASVEKKNKMYQSDSPNILPALTPPHDDPGHHRSTDSNALLINHSHVRSISSEIYSTTSQAGGDHHQHPNIDPDAASISTLEGKRYSPTQEQIRQATIVRADIHHHVMAQHHQQLMTSGTPPPPAPPPPPPPPIAVLHPIQFPPPPPKSAGQIPPLHHTIDWKLYIRAIENDRSTVLTDRDTDRWRRLITEDLEFRRRITDARSMDEFESIVTSSKYAKEFTREKWSRIVQDLSQVAFMRRLSNIIDTQHEQQQNHHQQRPLPQPPKSTTITGGGGTSMKPLDPSQLNSSYDMGETLRNLQRGRQKRIFTRESLYNAGNAQTGGESEEDGDDPKSTASDEVHQHNGNNGYAEPNPMSQTTTSMLSREQFRDRSSSEIFEMPPMLTVYLGGDASSNPNLYGETFNNLDHTYSTASNIGMSTSNVNTSYHHHHTNYDSTNGTDEDRAKMEGSGGAIAGGGGGGAEVYAEPTTVASTASSGSNNGRWKRF